MIDLTAIRLAAMAPAYLAFPGDPAKTHLGGSMVGGIGDPMTYCPSLWAWAAAVTSATSVLDIGCGHGYALDCFDQLGLETLGIDGHPEAVASAGAGVVLHDYATGPLRLVDQQFDLGWCCEFLEHVEESQLDHVFSTFASCQTLLITHAVPGQGGHHHVNEQPMGYWALQFLRRGFTLDENMTACGRLVATADSHLLGLATTNYFTRTGLVFRNQHA